jgi:hypothetical protein
LCTSFRDKESCRCLCPFLCAVSYVSVCFLLVRLRPPFILIPLPLPLTPWRMYVRIAGVGEFTTKQYPIKWYSYNSAIVYIYLSSGECLRLFVCVVLYWYIWSGCDPDAKTQGWRMFYGGCSNRRSYDCVYVFATKAVVERGCEAASLGNVCYWVDVSRMFVYGILMDSGCPCRESFTNRRILRSIWRWWILRWGTRFAGSLWHYTLRGWILAWIIHLRIRVVFSSWKLWVLCSGERLFVPGCWENRGGTADSYCSYIRWRFVAVFVGDKASLLRFDTYVSFPVFVWGRVALRGRWIYEWLESNPLVGWSPVVWRRPHRRVDYGVASGYWKWVAVCSARCSVRIVVPSVVPCVCINK